MNSIDLVVFDMAGTTVKDQNEVETCFWEAARQTGIVTTRERIISMMGWSKRLVFETLWLEQMGGALNAEIVNKTNASYAIFKEILENHYKTTTVFPTEGCLEIFQFLKGANVKIGLTTGFYREVTDIILAKLGWQQEHSNLDEKKLIDISVASDEVPFGRPYPYMIFKVMQILSINDVRKVVKIGDTPSDLGEGKNAGCLLSVGVTNGTHTSQQLSMCENDGLFGNLFEFQCFLEDYLR